LTAIGVYGVQGTRTQSTWDKIAESKEFQDLMATKRIFIVTAIILFVVYYFALPVLVGLCAAVHVH
jgi:uncharacterized membrane protein (DUF485 family)